MKINITCSVDVELIKKAKEKGLIISNILEEALQERLDNDNLDNLSIDELKALEEKFIKADKLKKELSELEGKNDKYKGTA